MQPEIKPAEIKSMSQSNFVTFSRYTAYGILIVLPFLGFWIGYQYGLTNQMSTITGAETEIAAIDDFEEKKAEVQKTIDALVGSLQDEIGTTTPIVTEQYRRGYLIYRDFDSTLRDLEVALADDSAATVAELPYLKALKKYESELLLTAPCFKATECGDGGLYMLDLDDNSVRSVTGGDKYYPMITDGVFSPDNTKIAVVSDTAFHNEVEKFDPGVTLGYIDIKNDSFVTLATLPVSESKRFAFCEMGCTSQLEWVGNELAAKVYEMSQCSYFDQYEKKTIYTEEKNCFPIISSTTERFVIK